MSGLSDHQRYFFDVNGYLVLDDVLDAPTVKHLNSVIDAQDLPPVGPDINSQRFGGFFMWDAGFRAMINHPGITGVLQELIGSGFRLDHAYGIVMSPGTAGGALHGGAFPMDLSSVYVNQGTQMRNGLTVASFALVDCDEETGGFCCIPGSHKANFPFPDQKTLDEVYPDFVKTVSQPAGSVVFFTEALTHGTTPWRAPYDRRSILLKYSPPHATWAQYREPDPALAALLDEDQLEMLGPPSWHVRVTRAAEKAREAARKAAG